MPVAARQLGPDAGEWLSLETVAELVGESASTLRWQAARTLANPSTRGLVRKAPNENGRMGWQFRPAFDRRLTLAKADRRSVLGLVEQYGPEKAAWAWCVSSL